MPTKDITVEFWARTPAYQKGATLSSKIFEDILDYATRLEDPEGELICGLRGMLAFVNSDSLQETTFSSIIEEHSTAAIASR